MARTPAGGPNLEVSAGGARLWYPEKSNEVWFPSRSVYSMRWIRFVDGAMVTVTARTMAASPRGGSGGDAAPRAPARGRRVGPRPRPHDGRFVARLQRRDDALAAILLLHHEGA